MRTTTVAAMSCLLAACRFNFDPAASDAGPTTSCPETYTVTLPSTGSRYRVTASVGLPADHQAQCAQDLPGATHLVVLDTFTEMNELDAVLQASPAPPRDRYYVGAIQRAAQSTLDAGWLLYTGEPVPPELWSTGEPDDLDDVEDGLESDAVMALGRLVDVSGTSEYGAVCECDGRMLAPEVSALLGGT